MKKLFFSFLALALALTLLPFLHQPAAATEVTQITQLSMARTAPQEGIHIPDLLASVDGGATVESIRVFDAVSGQELTEGHFENGMTYWIHYTLRPEPGKVFADTVTLTDNNAKKTLQPESETCLVYKVSFTTCNATSSVSLQLPMLSEGMNPEEIVFTTANAANYTVRSFSVTDPADETAAVTALERNKTYRLQVIVDAKAGYYFISSGKATCNNATMEFKAMNAGTYAEVSMDFSLDVGKVQIASLPDAIKQDASISTPKLSSTNKQVSISNIQWLDPEMNPYDKYQTNYFRANNTYYLTFTIRTAGPVGPWEAPDIDLKGLEGTTEVLDAQSVKITIPYTPLRKVGLVHVTTQGIGEGKPLSGVSATVDSDVILTGISFYDRDLGTYPTDGTFRSGTVYLVKFRVKAAEGYFIEGHNNVVVDGVTDNGTYSGEELHFSVPLVTYKRINSVKLSVSGVGVGKSISKTKVSDGSSKFYTDYKWYTTASSGSKFQKGHRYYLKFELNTKDGYCFADDVTVTVNGKKATDLEFYMFGTELYGVAEFSYVKEITKVSLPAMPKSIKPGSTLPTNFKVSTSANYTLEPVWISATTQQQVTQATEGDCYVLGFVAIAKDGCEFTADTVVYVDGKKVKPTVLSTNCVEVLKPYNVGLTVIDRVDLTLTEPKDGAAPEKATVAADAPYTLPEQAWYVNSANSLTGATGSISAFHNYRYYFLMAALQARSGYAFADNLSIYINGIKYAVIDTYSLGTVYQAAISFGKLGEIPQLTAPEVEKDGFTLRWETVLNATGYEIYRATSKSGSYVKVTHITSNSWTDVPVKGKTYYYKVKAIFAPDTVKNSPYSAVITIAYNCDAPEIQVENGTTGKPVITWEKISGAKKYTVYRATSETGKYSKLGTTTKLTYTDSKAKTGTQYFYKVIANASSSSYNSGYSNVASCNVICSSVTVTVKVDAATGKPSLTWGKVDGAAGYRILRQLPGEEGFAVIKEQTALTFLDTTAPIDTNCIYLVQVMGKTAALDSRMSAEISVTSGIAKPVLKTSIDASGKPELRWQTVEGAVKYEIYRSTKSTKSYSLLTTVEATGYTDESVAPGKTYYYKVIAIGAVSKSAESSYAKLSGKCATPQISVTINEDSGKPTLTWEKISGAKKYTVYRATSETGKYSKLGTTTKLTYTDSKATVGKTYYYKIVANASSGSYSSAYSNIVSSVTICAKPVVKATTVAATGKPQLTWSKVTGAKEYWILLDVDGQAQLLTTTTKLSFVDESAVPGETRRYAVWAINADPVCNSAMDAYTVTATCAQPKIKGAVGAAGKPEITITAVEGATKYVIYRSTSKSKNYKALDETETLTFTDTTATKGKTYYYKVVALCEDTESAQSAYAKVKSK